MIPGIPSSPIAMSSRPFPRSPSSRRLLLARAAAALAVLALPASHALAQPAGWPSQPVRIVVPAPAGSSLDIIARLLADKLKDRWGQPVNVENKPGAGGMLGVDVAAKATDGHTFAVGFNGPISFGPHLYKRMPYDPMQDLVPIVETTSQPNVLAVNAAKVPARTAREFVDWARAQHGAFNYSSLGNGSSSHLTMALFMQAAGFAGTHVPFNGSPPSALAVAQGEVDATFMVAPALLPHVQSGKVRLIATSAAQRPASLKDLPTLAESGFPQVESMAWNGLFGPRSTPPQVVSKVNADVNAALKDPAVARLLDSQGLTAVGGSPEAFAKLIAAEHRKWGEIVRHARIQID